MFVDHDRFMQLVAKMPELTEDQKRGIAEANNPKAGSAQWMR